MSDAVESHQGGGRCGRLRHRTDTAPDDLAHCHCDMYRKSSYGIVTTWVTLPPARFHWLRAPRRVSFHQTIRGAVSVPDAARGWRCSPRAPIPLDMTMAMLDHTGRHPANRHVWYTERLPAASG